MKKNLTELVFILDRSGSMTGLEGDTIGGFNAMIHKQKKEDGEALVTTLLFDNENELIHDRSNLKGVGDLTEKQYYTRGSTALLDAMGFAIQKIRRAHENTLKEERPDKTVFVIITDGHENSSTEYSKAKIKQMIEKCKKRDWEFIFLGANMDAVEVATQYGFAKKNVATYRSDAKGTATNYDAISEAVSSLRGTGVIEESWSASIVEYEEKTRK